jgi:predicted secreted Zn-dependent protease
MSLRSLIVSLPVIALIGLMVACSAETKSSNSDSQNQAITFEHSRADRVFSVYGTTSKEIVDSINSNGIINQYPELARLYPESVEADFVISMTVGESTFSVDRPSDGSECVLEGGNLQMEIVVYMPVHEEPGSLTKENRNRWTEVIRAAEQRELVHVEDLIETSKAAAVRLEALTGERVVCEILDKKINSVLDQMEEEKIARQLAVYEALKRQANELQRDFERQLDKLKKRNSPASEVNDLWSDVLWRSLMIKVTR